jgi:hypothetical protein
MKYIITDLISGWVFQGCNPEPVFGPGVYGVKIFNTENDALARIEEETRLFPSLMRGRTLIINKVIVVV